MNRVNNRRSYRVGSANSNHGIIFYLASVENMQMSVHRYA